MVGKSTRFTLGKEDIFWTGTDILANDKKVARAVKVEITPELIHVISLENGLPPAQSIMLLELFRLMGLDPSRPLIVTKTTRSVQPEILQDLNDSSTRTIVTRT